MYLLDTTRSFAVELLINERELPPDDNIPGEMFIFAA